MPNQKSRAEIQSIAILGTYPPRRCGIATFTADLANSFCTADPLVKVDPFVMSDLQDNHSSEVTVIEVGNRARYTAVAEQLNERRYDVLSIQHEYGIFGGDAGRYLLDLIRAVKMPVVTTLHTVLRNPTPDQRAVMEELLQLSTRVIVMSRTAIDLLHRVHSVDASKIDFIPHGIPKISKAAGTEMRAKIGGAGPILLTFGLLSPDKGVEHVIQAMPEILARCQEAKYLVVGATHPHVKAFSGESYRKNLEKTVKELGLSESVEFVDDFVSLEQLLSYLSAMDFYITPYLNAAQITSGTLAYSMGAGKVVLSTPYEYAKEVLAEGRGILVPFAESGPIADAVINSWTQPSVRRTMGDRAAKYGSLMHWERVGQLYLDSFSQAVSDSKLIPILVQPSVSQTKCEINLSHLERLTDDTGILQHATFSVPNRHEGYCVDDNARALLLTLELPESPRTNELQARYLAFLAHSLNPLNSKFRNFMGYDRTWLEAQGSEDSQGRALWSVGAVAGRSKNRAHSKLASKLFETAAPSLLAATSPRTWAYSILGAAAYLERYPDSLPAMELLVAGANRLERGFLIESSPDWKWLEDRLAYANARIPQSLMVAGTTLNRPVLVALGVNSMKWLLESQINAGGFFSPVGAAGASPEELGTVQFDQQPIEASSTLSACLTAYDLTHQSRFLAAAELCAAWFQGTNALGLNVGDPFTGACYDGIEATGLNENQGAESTLAYLASIVELASARKTTLRLESGAEYSPRAAIVFRSEQ
ncbi:MAG: glycosyltransferase family 4 protein [Armatimonadota bacterium]